MRVLQELVAIITKNKVKQIEVIGNENTQKSKITEFYELVAASKVTNDEEAAELLTNGDTNSSTYRNLKNTLKNRLINTVFFIDLKQPYYNDQQKAYFNCWKELAAVKILMVKSAKFAAVQLSKKILRQAIKYEFTELIVEILRFLRIHHSTFENNERLFKQYNQQLNRYAQMYLAEMKAEESYCKIMTLYKRKNPQKETIHKEARAFYEEIESSLVAFDSYKLHLYGRMIYMAIFMSINDYEKTAEACDEAITFFEKKKYISALALQTFLHQKLVCHTQLKQYNRGKDAAERSLAILEEGKFNWFKNLELYFMLSMHTKKYQKSYEVFSTVINHKMLAFQPASISEIWKIYEAYVHYLIILNKVVPAEDETRFTKFKLGRFLNEVPSFSKEKRRRNIPILIIQTLFLILQKRYNEAIDRIEAIEKYCYRYLRKDDSFRSNCFIKCLLLIPSCSFHKAAVTRKAKKYLVQLQQVPLEVANQPHEVEIIPYEDLWEMALNSLENEFYSASRSGR